MTAPCDRRVRCVGRFGFHRQSFVLPDQVFTAPGESEEEIIPQGPITGNHAYRIAGSLDAWREQVARLARGNSRLIMALSAAFAGPLLHLLEHESGGFHFRGHSSIGKSTALLAAASVWGGGRAPEYIRKWRTTDNALESIAAAHCDTLLLLDEMGQASPEVAGAVAYMLASGSGKSRAGRHGEGRAVAEWRCLFLSTGEIGLADKLAEDGRVRRVMAGQAVRIVDLPADAGRGYGLFEMLHEFGSAAELAQHLKSAGTANYGHPARAFLGALVKDLAGATEIAQQIQADFLGQQCPAGCDGQVVRVAMRFALVAAAGEMAAAFGVLPWAPGEATAGVARCFAAWLAARGGIGSAEEMEGIAAVRKYLVEYGSLRFELIKPPIDPDLPIQPSTDRALHHRVGYREQDDAGGWVFYVMPDSWGEICSGLDKQMVARALRARGMLQSSDDKKLAYLKRLPIGDGKGGKPQRCYKILPAIFHGGDDA
jgi:uncharacterized protein (DUF927 family)